MPARLTGRPGALSRSLVGSAIVIVAVATGVTSCSDPPTGVEVGMAVRADVVEVVDAPAAVTARAVATLSAPADGTLVAVYVSPGASVRPGRLLAVIDSPAARQRMADAKRTLAALRAGGTSGRRTYNLSVATRENDKAAAKAFAVARDAANKVVDPQLRAALLAQAGAAERAYQRAAQTARVTVASVQRGLASVGQAVNALTAAQRIQAEAAYDLAKSIVDALTLRAPVAGLVQFGGPAGGSRPLGLGASNGSVPDLAYAGVGGAGAASGPGIDPAPALGSRVPAGTPVVTVVDVRAPGLLAEVDETDVLLVKAGGTADVELEAVPGARYSATVRSVDVLPSTSARGDVSYRTRLALGAGTMPNGGSAPVPRPGMSAVAHLKLRSAPAAVVVPAGAVLRVDGQDAVWVVRAGKAQRVPVTVGLTSQNVVQVVAGVGEGDRVVVRGAHQVRPGQELP